MPSSLGIGPSLRTANAREGGSPSQPGSYLGDGRARQPDERLREWPGGRRSAPVRVEALSAAVGNVRPSGDPIVGGPERADPDRLTPGAGGGTAASGSRPGE